MHGKHLFIAVLSLLVCQCSGSGAGGVDAGGMPDLSSGLQGGQLCPCPSESYCELATNRCQPGCIDTSQCSHGAVCDTALRRCISGCAQDSDCTGAGQICDAGSTMCRPGCRTDAGCPKGEGCNLALAICQPQCTMDSQCKAGQICDPLSSLCRNGCREDANCGAGETCDMTSLLCVTSCTMDSQCGPGQICDPDKSYCRLGCRKNTDCGAGKTCDMTSLLCVTGCTKDSECPVGQVCDLAKSQCKPKPGFPGCVGRQCNVQYSCPSFLGPTTLTGTVSIPAGTLPIYGAKVFIPSANVPPSPTSGASCQLCSSVVPKDAVVSTTTDVDGKFTLRNVPSGNNIPVVIQIGKWRRVATVASIADCTTTALDTAQTRLPRNHTEGDIPKLALSTGATDALECLLRSSKLGLDDTEFTTEKGTGRVNLYSGGGTNQFSAALGGAMFTAAQVVPAASWWDTQASWNQYDIVLLSCEGAPDLNTKSTTARAALQGYINAGGRVLAEHYHNAWIASGPTPLSTVATFPNSNSFSNIDADIVTSFPGGMALKQWLSGAGALTGSGQLPISGGRNTIGTINTMLVQPWVTYLSGPSQIVQYFSFAAPVGAPAASQCGKMGFTDMHVSGDTGGDTSSSATPFPTGCVTTSLSAQDKALIFMLFDLTNCM